MSDPKEDRLFVKKIGPIAIDIPRTVGFYGGIAAAVALDMIAPPLGLAIAAVPLVKVLRRRNATLAEKVVAAVLEGAAKPVGGDSEGCVRTRAEQEDKEREAAKDDRAKSGEREPAALSAQSGAAPAN